MQEDNEKLFGDKKIPPRIMRKRLWHYVGPEWKSFALAFLLTPQPGGCRKASPLVSRPLPIHPFAEKSQSARFSQAA